MAYTKPQQRKKEESEQLRGERDEIKFIDLTKQKNNNCFSPKVRSCTALLRRSKYKRNNPE